MANLQYVINKRYDENFTMYWLGEEPEVLSNGSGHQLVVLTAEPPPCGISTITSYVDEVEEETKLQYLKKFFRYRQCKTGHWSDLTPMEQITGMTFKPDCELELELHYYYVYDGDPLNEPPSNIYLGEVQIEGEFVYQIEDSEAVVEPANPEVILQPKDVYKVFDLTGFQVVANSSPNASYEILYRFTQNAGRTFTPWEPLTVANISTLRLDELRFAQVQYLIKYLGSEGVAVIYDVILEGDFQNVSANYLKINRYGLKEDCLSSYLGAGEECEPGGDDGNGGDSSGGAYGGISKNFRCGGRALELNLSNYNSNEELDNLTQNQNVCDTWNPYENMDKITKWGNFLVNDLTNVFGWKVEYFLTDPDANGIDRYIHEYQLKNVIDQQQIKILVPDNNFKDEQVLINQFNMDLFDTFEIFISKDAFKKAFGINKRPARDDIIYLCPTNKLYMIKHAQAHKNIMNASLYYRIILKKYEQRPDIKFENQSHKDFIDNLTDNTTLEETLGIENEKEEAKIANKDQTFSLSQDKIRQVIDSKVDIVQEVILNGNIEISKTHYNMERLTAGQTAVNYKALDQKLEKGYNRSFITWFRVPSTYSPQKPLTKSVFDNYEVPTGVYNLIENYDTTNHNGYKHWLESGNILYQINKQSFELPAEILTGVWYATLVNMDQRQQKVKMYLYRRSTEIKITMFNKESYERIEMLTEDIPENAYKYYYLPGYEFPRIDTGYTYQDALNDGFWPVINEELIMENQTNNNLLLINSQEANLTPVEFEHKVELRLLASAMDYTNLRIYNEVISDDKHINILNENIVADSDQLIVADNANRQLFTTNYWTKNFR